MDARQEPWRRFEAKVDPEGQMDPAVRARKAKVAYRAFMRSMVMLRVVAPLLERTVRPALPVREASGGPLERG